MGALIAFASTGPETPERAEVRQRLRDITESIPVFKIVSDDVLVKPLIRAEFEWAEHNLLNWIHAGGCYLRICPHCENVYICFDKRREICTRPECSKMAGAKRQRKTRKSKSEQSLAQRQAAEAAEVERKFAAAKVAHKARHAK